MMMRSFLAALLLFPAAALAQGWTGPFVGAELTGSADGIATSESGALSHRFTASGTGIGGGVNLGYNWQAWPSALIGAVAGVDGPNNPGGNVFRTQDDVVGFLALRAGYLPRPDLLWYGQTGLALADETVSIDFGGPVSHLSRTATGYSLGGGVEWVLPASRASVFLDYQHIWWDGGSISAPAAIPSVNFRWQRDGNLLKAGLRLRFD